MKENAERLLKEAERLFAERGLEAVGIQEIVENCDLTKPTLYYYFGSREGLTQVLFRQGFLRLNSALDTQSVYEGDLPTYLKQQWKLWFGVVEAMPDFFRVALSALYLPPANTHQVQLKPHWDRLHHRFEELFTKATVHYGNMRGREHLLAFSWLGLLQHWTGAFLREGGLDPRVEDPILRPFLYGLFS